jgi:hypothetical protein
MPDTVNSLLTLRKLTRQVADDLRAEMTEHLATLTPLFRPRMVLGDYVRGVGAKEAPKRADKAFKDLQAAWESLPFGRSALIAPLDVAGATLEITPMEYGYSAIHGTGTKPFTVRCPLRWVLSYAGFAPARLAELLAGKERNTEELQRFVLHYLTLSVVIAQQPGLLKILDALHYPVVTERPEAFGGVPITYISCAIRTRRPADDVIVQSAEITGMDAFEEVVVVEDIEQMPDALRERMLATVRAVDEALLSPR